MIEKKEKTIQFLLHNPENKTNVLTVPDLLFL